MKPRIALWLLWAGCAHTGAPLWSDDSRSELGAQGTAIEPQKEQPPQSATAAGPTDPTAAPGAPAAAPLPPAEDDAPVPPDAPVVRLLEPGAEPRVRLRYRLAAGLTEDVSMSLSNTMATNFGTPLPPREVPVPTVRMLMSVTAAPAGKGELTSTMRVVELDAVDAPGGLPGLADRMRGDLAKLVGTTMQARVTTRGAVIKMETTLPSDAPASARGTMESLQSSYGSSAILPAEAVGVGARWETEHKLHQNGVDVKALTRYRVRELVGARVGLDLEMELTGASKEVRLPGAGGTPAQLDSMTGSGTGTLDLELGSVVPRRGRNSLDSQLAMRVPAVGQSVSVSMRMKTLIDLHAGR